MPQINFSPGDELTYLAATIAIAISKGLSNSDINLLAKFVKGIGENLDIIAASNASSTTNITNNSSGTDQY